MESIGNGAFEGCTSLGTVTTVGKGTWGDNLWWELDSEGTLVIRGQGQMEESRYDAPWSSHDKNIKKVVIEQGVTSIAGRAFDDCENLTTVLLPESVASIGDFAFSNCAKLTDIQIGDAVVSIEA